MIAPWPQDEETSAPVEQILLRCVDAGPATRQTLFDELCQRNPDLAAELRLRWGLLAEVGFLDDRENASGLPERFGPFRILRRLGGGGMGVVYLAEQEGLGRQVALKVLRPEFALSERARARFRQEGATLARIEHPGICPVYEVGDVDGCPYLAMRYLVGTTLGDLVMLARRRAESGAVSLPGEDLQSSAETAQATDRARVQQVVRAFERIALAADAAHRAGLVHRDLKPANVMITTRGEPVILDFGLVQDQALDLGLTHTGDLLGTPAYLAPEQLAGSGHVDARTDVYALGVGLYECLTLVRPFDAPSREALYRLILAGRCIGLRTRNRHVSRDLAIVVGKAMEPDATRRYASAAALAEDLRRVRMREPILARPAPLPLRTWRWTQRNPVLAAFVLLLIVATALSGVLLLHARAQLRQTQALAVAHLAYQVSEREPKTGLWLAHRAAILDERVETRSRLYSGIARSHEEQRFLAGQNVINSVRYASDGRRLVSASDDWFGRVWDLDHPEAPPIVVKHEDCVTDAHFVGSAQDRVLTTSLDGTAGLWQLGHGAATILHRFGALGDGAIMGARVAPDGQTALLLRNDQPLLVGLEPPSELQRLPHSGRIEAASFSADGTVAATAVGYGREEKPDGVKFTARVWRVADGKLLSEVEHSDSLRSVCFLPDGSLLTASLDETAQRWQPETGARIGDPIRHGSPIWSAIAGEIDGKTWIALGGAAKCSLRLFHMPTAFGSVGLVREQPGPALTVALSSIGDGILAAMYDGTVRIYDLEGRELQVLRGHSARISAATPAPITGPRPLRRIATASWDGTVRTWRIDDPVLRPSGLHDRPVHIAACDKGLVSLSMLSLRLAPCDGTPVEVPLRSALDVWVNVAPPTISKNGELVACVTRDHRVRSFDFTGRRVGDFAIEASHRNSRAMYQIQSLDDNHLLLLTGPHRISTWDTQGVSKGLDREIVGIGDVYSIASDRHGKRFACAGEKGVAIFGIDGTQQGEPLRSAMVGAVAFSQDGKRLAAALRQDSGRRVLVYDLDHPHTQPVVLFGHSGDVDSVAFVLDGRLLTGCFDGSARIWATDGSLWARLELGDMGTTHACSEPSGEWILTAHRGTGLRRWPAAMPFLLELSASRARPGSVEEEADYGARLEAALRPR